MKRQKISLMAVVSCMALLAALSLAGAQADSQLERKSKGKQVEGKGKVIEADDLRTRGAKIVERKSQKGKKGEVIEADNQEKPSVITRDYRPKKGQPDRVPAKPGQGPVISTNSCPDPAAREIRFAILSRTTARSGRVQIEGIVHNIGRAVYESPSDVQSKVQLWQVGSGAPRLVAEKNFTSLIPELVNNPRSSLARAVPVVRVQFERDWDSRSPNLGEFPPSYRLVVAYINSRPGSGRAPNDCNLRNNVKERSGADINTMFRQ